MNNLYGLIGEKLSHSKSPEIHKLILDDMNLKGGYFLFELIENDLKKAIDGFKVLGFRGVNVTIPYKVKVLDFLDDISNEAARIGAINTIKFDDGRAIGFNTDYDGFCALLNRYNIKIKSKKIIVLGTGGAAKAVIECLKDLEAAEIIVVTRKKLNKEYLNLQLVEYDELKNFDGDILVNCTPIGMNPKINQSPIRKELVEKYETVIDLIYNPLETLLIKYAKELKIPAYDGLYMLVTQAIKSQEIWNEVYITRDKIEKIYKRIYEDMFNLCKNME